MIDQARTRSKNVAEMPTILEDELSCVSLTEILDFAAYLAMFLDTAHDRRLLVAFSIITGSTSSDGFVYFKCWLIAQGEKVFKVSLENPDSLATIPSFNEGPLGPEPYLEGMLYVANKAFKKKTAGMPMSDSERVVPGWKPPVGVNPSSTGLKNSNFWDDDKAGSIGLSPDLAKRFSEVK